MPDDTRWLNEREQRTWRGFLTAARLVFDLVERQLQRDAGLPHGYWEVLVRLSETPGRALRMSELAETTLFSRSRLSHAISRMEQAGWVRRRTCAHDRRGQLAELTGEGMAVLEATAPGHVEQVRSLLFDGLTREQQEALREVSEAIVDHITDHNRPWTMAPAKVEEGLDEGTC